MRPTLNYTKPKLCIHCKHYSTERITMKGGLMAVAQCLHPDNASLVDGKPRETPAQLRHGMYSGACQTIGFWWEPKE